MARPRWSPVVDFHVNLLFVDVVDGPLDSPVGAQVRQPGRTPAIVQAGGIAAARVKEDGENAGLVPSGTRLKGTEGTKPTHRKILASDSILWVEVTLAVEGQLKAGVSGNTVTLKFGQDSASWAAIVNAGQYG